MAYNLEYDKGTVIKNHINHTLISQGFLFLNIVIFMGLIVLCFLGNFLYRLNQINNFEEKIAELTIDKNVLERNISETNNELDKTKYELRKIQAYYGQVIGIAESVTLGSRDMEIFLDQKADRTSWQNLLNKVTQGMNIQEWFTSASQDIKPEDVKNYDHLKVVITLTGGNRPK